MKPSRISKISWLKAYCILTMFSVGPSALVQASTVNPYEEVYRYTVKVNNRTADIFSGDPEGSHGTGFLVEIRKGPDGEKIGVVFTNRHVVERESPSAQSLTLDFNSDTAVPETVSATPVYVSPINDFAVLEFPLSKLKRVSKMIRPARLPKPASPLYRLYRSQEESRRLQGRAVLAFGNPMDSVNHASEGMISGIQTDNHSGTFISTTAPINPGNSGGPLIDLETGEVIGLNTAKYSDADNMGFVTPIGVVLDEYKAWRKDPSIARARSIYAITSRVPQPALKALSSEIPILIEKIAPKYFENFSEILKVEDADPTSQLRTGDLLVTINGEVLPPSQYELRRRVLSSSGPLKARIVRDFKILDVEIPVMDSTYHALRSEVDFVIISGLVFTNISHRERWLIDHHLTSTAQFNFTHEVPELRFGEMVRPSLNSILVNINLNGRDVPIHDVGDIRRLLRSLTAQDRFARFDFRTPVYIETNQGPMPARTLTGVVAYNPVIKSFIIPLHDIITPRELSLSRFLKNFSFDQGRPETRDLRAAIRTRAAKCESLLKAD